MARQAALPMTVVDTVGAGDGFVAGGSVPTRLRTTTQVGAHAGLGPGNWQSMPTRADLQVDDGADLVER